MKKKLKLKDVSKKSKHKLISRSISITEEMYEEMKYEAKQLKLNVSAYLRYLHVEHTARVHNDGK